VPCGLAGHGIVFGAGGAGLDRGDLKILDGLELCGFGREELRLGGFEDSVFAALAAEMEPGVRGDVGRESRSPRKVSWVDGVMRMR
jgi:hypothetical protein